MTSDGLVADGRRLLAILTDLQSKLPSTTGKRVAHTLRKVEDWEAEFENLDPLARLCEGKLSESEMSELISLWCEISSACLNLRS
jgi:hypothetical protein